MSCRSNSLLIESHKPFNTQSLRELDCFDSTVESENSKWLLLAYVPVLSCQTCTDRDLKHMAEMHRLYSDKIDFTLVCNDANFQYIRNLRRVAGISFPVLIEKNEGALGLQPRFHFLLIDKTLDQSLLQFNPSPTIPLNEGMILFERAILEKIK